MKIVSFAWTTEALLAGRKTVTRRCWNERYAGRFKSGDLVQAYDRNPSGGRTV
ncbi:MAG: ASCH domain-containing protein [Deltaproteobacteria bacterium]|nr:ASCH domain-containing protein [Deltaproteobacteria bacterium]MBW2345101.1 ASCH domain-containing protein [Deltaproteobacteria bacterium]